MGDPTSVAGERASILALLLRQNPIFAALDAATLGQICASYPLQTVAPRSLIIEAGAPSEHLFVLLSGTVRVFHRCSDGREATVKLLRAPSLFADLEVLHGLRMLESVDAVDEASLIRIPGPAYIELVQRFPAAMFEHLRHLAAAFSVAARSEQQVFARLDQRIANLLLSYADAAAERVERSPDQPRQLSVELSLADITRSLGTVRRSVSRIVNGWRREGALDERDGRWILLRPALFEKLAAPIRHCFNYRMGMALEPLARQTGLPTARLEITRGHARWVGRVAAVVQELIIGRQPPAHLLLPGDFISPQHCRVFRAATGGRYWLEDLDSLNGCAINDRPTRLGVLKEGDRIRAGGYELMFHTGSRS